MAIDEKILSIDSDDDNLSVVEFSEFLQEDTERKKRQAAAMINELGDVLIKGVEKKRKAEMLKAEKMIPYILKHTDDYYDKDELFTYSFKDIEMIYHSVKQEHSSFFVKFFRFIFNL
jgi:hypothetical protein